MIIPEDAEMIKQMFQMYIDGISMRTIAKELNDAGCRSVNGKLFTEGTIRQLLHNDVYAGIIRRQKAYILDPISGKKIINDGVLPQYVIEDAHEAMLNALPLAGGIDTVYSFWQMLSWIGIVFLTIYDLFSFFYLNKDRMLHLLPISKYRLLWMKAIVFGTYMLLFFVVSLVRYLIILPDNAAKSLIKVGLTYLFSKMAAIFSFLSLLIVLLLVIKKINNSVLGAIIMASLFVGIVGAQAYGLFHIVNASHDISWIIGIVDGATGMNQYANILPIVFTEIDDKFHYVEDSFYIISVWLNIGISIISLIASRILFKTQRFN